MELVEEYPDNRSRFMGCQKVSPEAHRHYEQQIEKRFIFDSLKSLPIEKLKQLINFEKINPFDEKTPDSQEEAEYRQNLRSQGVIEFRMEILI